MKKTYVIEENWDNNETYEDHANETTAIGVALTKELAQRIIDTRRNTLIAKAKADLEDRKLEDGAFLEIKTIPDENGRIVFKHDFCSEAFDTYNFGTDEYWWIIKELPLIES